MVRLFIGGLPADVTAEALTQRFVPFGDVSSCEVVPEKTHGPGGVAAHQSERCRGFAYVELRPKDDAALGRCLSLYNHSTWRGHALRVEVAKAHYLLRLQQEWDEAKQRELDFGAGKGKRTRSSSSVAGAVGEADDDYWEPWDGIPRPLDISQPMVLLLARKRKKNKVLKVDLDPAATAGNLKRFFPPARPLPLQQLPWDYGQEAPYRHVEHLNQLWDNRAVPQPRPATSQLAPIDSNPAGGCGGAEAPADARAAAPSAAPRPTAAVPPPAALTKADSRAKAPAPHSHEAHGYLKILKSISSANEKEEAAAAAAAAAAAGTARSRQAAKAAARSGGVALAPLVRPQPAAGAGVAGAGATGKGAEAVVSFYDDDDDGGEVAGGDEDLMQRFGSDDDDDDDVDVDEGEEEEDEAALGMSGSEKGGEGAVHTEAMVGQEQDEEADVELGHLEQEAEEEDEEEEEEKKENAGKEQENEEEEENEGEEEGHVELASEGEEEGSEPCDENVPSEPDSVGDGNLPSDPDSMESGSEEPEGQESDDNDSWERAVARQLHGDAWPEQGEVPGSTGKAAAGGSAIQRPQLVAGAGAAVSGASGKEAGAAAGLRRDTPQGLGMSDSKDTLVVNLTEFGGLSQDGHAEDQDEEEEEEEEVQENEQGSAEPEEEEQEGEPKPDGSSGGDAEGSLASESDHGHDEQLPDNDMVEKSEGDAQVAAGVQSTTEGQALPQHRFGKTGEKRQPGRQPQAASKAGSVLDSGKSKRSTGGAPTGHRGLDKPAVLRDVPLGGRSAPVGNRPRPGTAQFHKQWLSQFDSDSEEEVYHDVDSDGDEGAAGRQDIQQGVRQEGRKPVGSDVAAGKNQHSLKREHGVEGTIHQDKGTGSQRKRPQTTGAKASKGSEHSRALALTKPELQDTNATHKRSKNTNAGSSSAHAKLSNLKPDSAPEPMSLAQGAGHENRQATNAHGVSMPTHAPSGGASTQATSGTALVVGPDRSGGSTKAANGNARTHPLQVRSPWGPAPTTALATGAPQGVGHSPHGPSQAQVLQTANQSARGQSLAAAPPPIGVPEAPGAKAASQGAVAMQQGGREAPVSQQAASRPSTSKPSPRPAAKHTDHHGQSAIATGAASKGRPAAPAPAQPAPDQPAPAQPAPVQPAPAQQAVAAAGVRRPAMVAGQGAQHFTFSFFGAAQPAVPASTTTSRNDAKQPVLAPQAIPHSHAPAETKLVAPSLAQPRAERRPLTPAAAAIAAAPAAQQSSGPSQQQHHAAAPTAPAVPAHSPSQQGRAAAPAAAATAPPAAAAAAAAATAPPAAPMEPSSGPGVRQQAGAAAPPAAPAGGLSLPGGLSFAGAFMRTKSAEETQAARQAQRGTLTAGMKKVRRAATGNTHRSTPGRR